MADQVGSTIGPYQITEPLGVGGMGEVYKAYHAGLEVFRAIKFIRPEFSMAADFRARFQKEARSVARLRHPNIVQVHDFGEHDGRFYMVMEYVDGQSLKAVIANHEPMAIDTAVALVKEIAGALDHAHQQGLIHRDIKPDNIMLDAHHRAVLMDFGIARLIIGDGNLTATGMGIGTPTYMAPEQLKALKVGPYTDVYSLSIVLFELLTGRAPFQADTPLAVLLKSLNDPMPTPRTLNPKISEELEAVILKGTAREASQRYQTAAEFMHALDEVTRVLGKSPQANASPARVDADPRGVTLKVQPSLSTEASSRSLIVGLIAVVFVIALAFAGSWWWSSNSMQVASDAKLPESDPAQPDVTASVAVKSIAVLPFADMSEKRDQEYLADGMAEEILNLLARVPGLLVPARTSSFYFKGKQVKIPDIARELGVVNVLEGSIRRSGDRLRVTAQLVRADNGYHLWSETYDRNLDDVFKVQDEIASAVVQALQIKLAGGEVNRRKGGTQNLEAYLLYLRSLSRYAENTLSGIEAATQDLGKATSLDPDFGLGWVMLGATSIAKKELDVRLEPEGFELAREQFEKALRLSPELARAHTGLSYIHKIHDWDWAAAEAEGQRAFAIDPSDPEVLRVLGILSTTLGRGEQAVQQLQLALVQDPLNPWYNFLLAMAHYSVGQFADSERRYRRTLELAPEFYWAHAYLGATYLAQGKPEAALESVRQENDDFTRHFYLPIVLRATGKDTEADQALTELIARLTLGSGSYWVAMNYAYRGEADQAFDWLDRAYREKDLGLSDIVGEVLFANIADDPRFEAFLVRMKLPTEWAKRIAATSL